MKVSNRQGINAANNTKMNHIMVSFSDHYNSILIERDP